MPVLFQYLLKLSISLILVFLFYRFVLRRLTFYHLNRWYLLGYSFLAYFIPFIDISVILEGNKWKNNELINFIPSFEEFVPVNADTPNISAEWNQWNWIFLVLAIGIGIMLLRLFIQLFSFQRMLNRSSLIHRDSIKIHQVDEKIIPFSFGNSIFVNQHLHNESELKEIVRHEFVHIKQKHTIDIIWSELLCIFNWYNPFSWLIRKAIRQNLEFIADNKVLEEGIDKKEYQYLLLKVIGNNDFSIANQFNFSSLKKRIAMMNKIQTARIHLVKFLFVLPLLVVLLLAFRYEQKESAVTRVEKSVSPKMAHAVMQIPAAVIADTIPDAPANSKGYHIDIKDKQGHRTVIVKDKNKKVVENVDLLKWEENKPQYEEQFGEILAPPKFIRPLSGETAINLQGMSTTQIEAGKVEQSVNSEHAISATIGEPVIALNTVSVNGGINPTKALQGTAVTNVISQPTIQTTVAADISALATVNGQVTALITEPEINPAEKILELQITKMSTKDQLDQLITEAKSKGVELEFEEIDYNEKGILTAISGRLKKEDAQGNFTAHGFEKVILTLYKVDVGKNKDKGKYTIRVNIIEKARS